MGTRKGKSESDNSEKKNTLKKPPGRKGTSMKTQKKKDEVTDFIGTSPRSMDDGIEQGTDYSRKDKSKLHDFEDLGTRIARRAYELYERRGGDPGHELEDWLEAERQIFEERKGEDF